MSSSQADVFEFVWICRADADSAESETHDPACAVCALVGRRPSFFILFVGRHELSRSPFPLTLTAHTPSANAKRYSNRYALRFMAHVILSVCH